MDEDAGPRHFFKQYQEEFIRHVDLDVIIPKLNKRRLLTDNEYQTVTHQPYIPNNRKRNLCDILYQKPHDDAWEVLECLEENSHRNHSDLAGKLKLYLQQWPRGCQETSEMEVGMHMGGFPQDPPRPYSSTYTEVISYISSALCQKKISMDHILRILRDLEICNLQIPNAVSDFQTLVVSLHEQGLCHKLDTDLLCKVLHSIPAVELSKRLKEYSNSQSDVDILCHDCFPQSVAPSSQHFIAFTHHTLPTMSLRHVLVMKDILSDCLNISRHLFTLKRADLGETAGGESVVLAWGFPMKHLELLNVHFRSDKLMKTLENMKEIELVKVWYQSDSEPEVILENVVTRKRKRSDEVCSAEHVKVPRSCQDTYSGNWCAQYTWYM